MTGNQKLGLSLSSLTIVLLLIAALAGAVGCSVLPPSRQYVDDLAQIERQVRDARIAELRHELGKKADSVATATEFTKVRGDLATVGVRVDAEKSAREAAVAGVRKDLGAEIAAREQGIAQLAERLTGAETVAAKQAADIGRVQAATVGAQQALANEARVRAEALAAKADKAEVAKVKATANTAVAKATALTRRVGVNEDVASRGNVKVVQLLFPSGRADAAGKLTAGTTVVPATMAAVQDLIAGLVSSGEWYIDEVVGHADARPFMDGRGKKRADSDALNASLAEARAWAVSETLDEILGDAAGAFVVSGAGITTRYGSHDADRSVIVVMRRVAP